MIFFVVKYFCIDGDGCSADGQFLLVIKRSKKILNRRWYSFVQQFCTVIVVFILKIND